MFDLTHACTHAHTHRVHDSVGSQPTAAAFEGAVDFVGLAQSSGYATATTCATAAEIVPAVEKQLASNPNGPLFLEVRASACSRRWSGLTPHANARAHTRTFACA